MIKESMRILVTGGAGNIGTNLCNELRSRGHHVIALDLYKKITGLLKRKTVLNADQQILKWKLNELTSNSSGITGISNVKVTDPKPSFKVSVFKLIIISCH